MPSSCICLLTVKHIVVRHPTVLLHQIAIDVIRFTIPCKFRFQAIKHQPFKRRAHCLANSMLPSIKAVPISIEQAMSVSAESISAAEPPWELFEKTILLFPSGVNKFYIEARQCESMYFLTVL